MRLRPLHKPRCYGVRGGYIATEYRRPLVRSACRNQLGSPLRVWRLTKGKPRVPSLQNSDCRLLLE
jgi:hypothetical protein